MNVMPVNCNSEKTNFKADVKIARGPYTKKHLVDSVNQAKAWQTLDKLQSIYKDTTITVGAKIDKNGRPVVYAFNPVTNCELTHPTVINEYENLIGYNGSINELYEKITNPNALEYLIFWPADAKGNYEIPEDRIYTETSYPYARNHSIYVN